MFPEVRKHRAPKGALRRPSGKTSTGLLQLVGKHRAPKGALRNHVEYAIRPIGGNGQKTPSAKRCIKTACGHAGYRQRWCQKAPSAKRCIKTVNTQLLGTSHATSQKAPSAKRCIKTKPTGQAYAVLTLSESTERQKVH